jgi:putative acetyltransferase
MKYKLTQEIIFEEIEIGLKPTNELVCGLIELFFNTVHSVNSDDYTCEQLNIWAPEDINPEKWIDRIYKNYLVTAKDGNNIVGFGELTSEGCVDMLYVHKGYLRQKIGKQLLGYIIRRALKLGMGEIFVEASVTARPFFESLGFDTIKKMVKQLNDCEFIVYMMNKQIQGA